MLIQELTLTVKTFFTEALQREAHIIGVLRQENGWTVQVETVEDSEYMRNRALDDVMGLYEVEVNSRMEIMGYKRIALRERPNIEAPGQEE